MRSVWSDATMESPSVFVERGDAAVRIDLPGGVAVSGEGVFDVAVWAAFDTTQEHRVVVTKLEISVAGVNERGVQLAGAPLGRGIQASDLRRIPLMEYVEYLLTQPPVATAMRRVADDTSTSDSWRAVDGPVDRSLTQEAKRQTSVGRGRRKPEDERLEQLMAVAAAVMDPERTSTQEEAVMALGWGRSTAKRLAGEAREAGLLPHSTRSQAAQARRSPRS